MPDQRDQFQRRIEALVEQVRHWVEPHEWVTKPYTKKLRDVDGEVYAVPVLFLQKGPIRVLLDPVAYDVPGSEGVVDLYLMPASSLARSTPQEAKIALAPPLEPAR